jgi:hypothetical protein
MDETSLHRISYVLAAACSLNPLNLDTGLSDHFGSTSTSQQPKASLLEPLGKREQASLVIDREKGCL